MAVATAIAALGPPSLLGVALSGLTWLVPLLLAAGILVAVRGRMAFPVAIWLPWAIFVAAYILLADTDHALQRSVMILCPIVVGMAASKPRDVAVGIAAIPKTLRRLTVAVWISFLLGSGILATGALPDATGFAAGVMTGALLCTYFAASYALGAGNDLRWWGALSILPVIAVTRMGILATGLTLPATLAPLRLWKRAALVGAMVLAGLLVFQTERVQRKMFFGGSGTLADVTLDNPDFATTGRRTMWDAMTAEIERAPWFGHGANASEPFVAVLTGGITHPHNDWLRLAFDYGYIGTALFALTFAAQALHLWWKARRASGSARTLFYAGASSFLVFALFMFSDNVILYAAFFGNLQFTLIGLAYGADAAARGATA